ncbi:hypothetical protein TWF569_010537 [Orbilia oligospora]|nr:hypothetical protein TWF569_010537 [Orbilia oligospora]
MRFFGWFSLLGDNEYKQSISLRCFEFYSLALQSRYESISIEFDVRSFKWKPFASSLLLEPVRGQERYPKALKFIPSQAFEEKRKDSKYTVKDLKRGFARRGNICFDAVKSITRRAAKEIFDDSFAGPAFEVLKQFPNLVNLTIPITHAILTRKVRIGKTRNARKNREKRHLSELQIKIPLLPDILASKRVLRRLGADQVELKYPEMFTDFLLILVARNLCPQR